MGPTSIARSLVSAESVAYERPEAVLLRGDSLEVLARWPSGSVDMIFADPPYRLSSGGFSCQNGRRACVDKGKWDVPRSVAEDDEFNLGWLEQCQRVLKPSGTIWVTGTQHVIYSIGFGMQRLGYHLLNTITWLKPNASPNLSCRFFTHSSEIVIWASPLRSTPLRHTFNYAEMKAENGGKQMRDVWEIPVPPRSEKLHGRHPTQKPLRLLRRILTASTRPGDLVLDPFAGSASTGIACLELGRSFVGIELERQFVELAAHRLGTARAAGPVAVGETVRGEAGRRRTGTAG